MKPHCLKTAIVDNRYCRQLSYESTYDTVSTLRLIVCLFSLEADVYVLANDLFQQCPTQNREFVSGYYSLCLQIKSNMNSSEFG